MRERAFDLEMELEGEPIIVQGIIDCCFEEDGELVLLDYKTNWIDPQKPFEDEAERIRAAYEKQIEIYKEALEEGLGKRVKESVLYLFDAGKMIRMQEKL